MVAGKPVGRRLTVLADRRGWSTVCMLAALMCAAVIPQAMAETADAGGSQWLVAVVCVAGSAVLAWIARRVSIRSMSSLKLRRHRSRVMCARLGWSLAASGIRLPVERHRFRPRLLVSTVVVVATCVAVSRPEVVALIDDYAPHAVTAEQVAATQGRMQWWDAGFPGDVPGSVLLSGVLREELFYRGLWLLFPIAIVRALPVYDRRTRGAVVVAVTAATWLLSTFTFGDSHAEFSAFNVATATVSGAVFGAAAVWTRSLLPAVIGHALTNLIATGVI